MRVIFVLFDSLNRHFLESYGSTHLKTPNFNRLAARSVSFEKHFVGSLPCMPARRDLQTGKLSFLHRSWGPLEPFDTSIFDLMSQSDIYSHLITDHYHYFEDGAANYHTRFSSYEYFRGQEGDKWQPTLGAPLSELREKYHPDQYCDTQGSLALHNMVNREHIESEGDFPSTLCFDAACQFLKTQRETQNWFLQIETFDPHEPFSGPPGTQMDLAGEDGIRDWPSYDRFDDNYPENQQMIESYKRLVAHCDEQLGRLLDLMDTQDMWADTMLVVTTDHGYLLGEHQWWAKNRMPCYNEIANVPLFVHDPRHAQQSGTKRSALTQSIDLPATVLEFFDVSEPKAMAGKSVQTLVQNDHDDNHDALIFGYFGGAVNLIDGRYTYFRYPEEFDDQELFEYTLMPAHMHRPFVEEELAGATLVHDSAFSAGFPVLRVPVNRNSGWYSGHGPGGMRDTKSAIYDLESDPRQENPIHDAVLEKQLATKMAELMTKHGAPPEAFKRLGLTRMGNE